MMKRPNAVTQLDIGDLRGASEPPYLRWLLLATLPFGVVAAFHFGLAPEVQVGDHAQYLLHARALAEGRGYRDTGYIFSSVNPWLGPAAQPPGLPLTLWLVFEVLGVRMLAVKFLMLGFALGYLVFAGAYFARRYGAPLGLGVALLAGLSPTMIHQAVQPLTDLPFCMFVWATINVVDRPGPWRWRRVLGVTALGGIAMLYRTSGLILPMALAAFALIRFREHRFRPLIPVAVWGGAGLVGALVMSVGAGFLGSLSLVPRLFSKATYSITRYRFSFLEGQLYPFPWDAVNDVYHVLASILVLVGIGAFLLKQRRDFAVAFTVLYVIMLVIAPISDLRYVWPLFPVIVFGLLNGVVTVGRALLRGRPASPLPAILPVALALFLAAATTVNHAFETYEEGIEGRPEVEALFARLRERKAVEPLRVVFFMPRVLAWQTGVPAMAYLPAVPDTVIAEFCAQGITHVIEGELGEAPSESEALRAAMRSHPDLFAIDEVLAGFTLYRFRSESCPNAR